MIEWRDDGLVLVVRRLGENDAIVEALTPGRGRHAGVVRGGGGRRMAPLLQPGSILRLMWRARLDAHLGHFTVEPLQSRAGLMADRDALAGLTAMTALLSFALPEREAQPGLYEATEAVIGLMEQGVDWPLAYLRWEMALLDRMGFGLDLGRCAVTGQGDDLAYVSPKTGRAVSRQAAGDWADRLFPLPACLVGPGPSDRETLSRGLRITGYFMEKWLAPATGDKPVPAARGRLVARLARHTQDL